jgi:hypothetical protein
VKLNACPLTYRYRQIDASAWTAQFWKRIVFENWPIGRELGVPGAGTDKAEQEKRRRNRHANDAMGLKPRCPDAQLGPRWAPNCGRVRLTICKPNAAFFG